MAKNKDVTTSHLSRRTVVKGAAWSVPVIAVAAAAPAAAASETTEVSNFSINGDCGVLGVLGPGFDLTADASTPIPAGTVITVSAVGLASIGALQLGLSGGLAGIADIQLLSGSDTYQVTLTAPFSGAGRLTTVLQISLGTTVTGSISLPAGYTAGNNVKTTGSFEGTAIFCSDS